MVLDSMLKKKKKKKKKKTRGNISIPIGWWLTQGFV